MAKTKQTDVLARLADEARRAGRPLPLQDGPRHRRRDEPERPGHTLASKGAAWRSSRSASMTRTPVEALEAFRLSEDREARKTSTSRKTASKKKS